MQSKSRLSCLDVETLQSAENCIPLLNRETSGGSKPWYNIIVVSLIPSDPQPVPGYSDLSSPEVRPVFEPVPQLFVMPNKLGGDLFPAQELSGCSIDGVVGPADR